MENSIISRVVCSVEAFEDDRNIFRCSVGDNKYLELLEEIKNNKKNIFQAFTEHPSQTRRKILKEVLSTFSFEYPSNLELGKKQSDYWKLNSFLGRPFVFYDSHLHSLIEIKDYLEQKEDKFVWIRLDNHDDCVYHHNEFRENHPNKANYVLHLMRDKNISRKIREIYWVSARWNSGQSVGKMSEENLLAFEDIERPPTTRYIVDNLENLPKIKAPVILDIDLDGLEKWMGAEWGGNFYAGKNVFAETLNKEDLEEIIWENENFLTIHPIRAARILRQRIKNPALILVATERNYRSRLFHNLVEYDFLKTLVE